MTYEAFLEKVKSEISRRFEDNYEVYIQKFPKNNGIVYDGLSIFNPECNLAPTIYLNPYYHWYLDGISMEAICENIIETYNERNPQKDFDTSFFTDYGKARSNIIAKLINCEKNQELLQKVPHFKFLDLAVVFQCMVNSNEDGVATILIHNHHLDFWNITPDELYTVALENTSRLFPYQMENMEELLKDSMPMFPQEMQLQSCPLYILTNEMKLNGASVILYPKLIKKLANDFKSDFVLLPSSVHEWLLIPAESPENISMFSQMVTEVNDTQLSDEEKLSDHAYYYSRNMDMIFVNADEIELMCSAS